MLQLNYILISCLFFILKFNVLFIKNYDGVDTTDGYFAQGYESQMINNHPELLHSTGADFNVKARVSQKTTLWTL